MKLLILTLAAAIAIAAFAQTPQLTEDQRKAQDLLRQTIEERQRKNPQTNTAPRLTHAEIEQQYLAGKITARQFQQFLRQQPPGTRMSPEQHDKALEMLRALTGKTNAPSSAAPAPAGKTPGAKSDSAPEPATPEIVDVEGKIRELERLKEAREKSTNAPAAATPKTKREKLDALLKQLVDGKITDAEYKEQRNKIIAGPD